MFEMFGNKYFENLKINNNNMGFVIKITERKYKYKCI